MFALEIADGEKEVSECESSRIEPLRRQENITRFLEILETWKRWQQGGRARVGSFPAVPRAGLLDLLYEGLNGEPLCSGFDTLFVNLVSSTSGRTARKLNRSLGERRNACKLFVCSSSLVSYSFVFAGRSASCYCCWPVFSVVCPLGLQQRRAHIEKDSSLLMAISKRIQCRLPLGSFPSPPLTHHPLFNI